MKIRKGEEMEKTAGHIIKSSDVRVEGRFRLDGSQSGPCSTGTKGMVLAGAQARIVESQAEFAVIEVTCGCGARNYIRCEYIGN